MIKNKRNWIPLYKSFDNVPSLKSAMSNIAISSEVAMRRDNGGN